MKPAQRVSQIQPSATFAISAKAKALRQQGKHVISFGVGEPDFRTPHHVNQMAVQAIRRGQTRYTVVGGIDELKDAVLLEIETGYGLEFSRENVLVSCGGKHALFNLFLALLDPGDEVIIPSPYWVSYPDMVRLAGATPVFVPCSESTGFKMEPAGLQRAISPKTRMLIINSPSNPTGAHYRRHELEALAEVLRAHAGIALVSDDIYYRILFDGEEWVNFAMLGEDLRERTFIVNGVSKTYAMTGWRIGYLVGDAEVVKAANKIQGQSTSNPCSMAQWAAVAALRGDQACVTHMVSVFEERRHYVLQRLNDIPGVTCAVPAGAFYVFPNVSAFYGSRVGGRTIDGSAGLADYLLETVHLAVVPGNAFGEDRCIRLSYALSMQDLEEGFDRLASALKALQPA